VESLSTYARQSIGQMDKPDVIHRGLSRRSPSSSGLPPQPPSPWVRSGDLRQPRLQFARIGVPHCPSAAGDPFPFIDTRWRHPRLERQYPVTSRPRSPGEEGRIQKELRYT
jgi:hypothetical protein